MPASAACALSGVRAGTTTAKLDVEVRNADWGKNACYLVGTDRLCPGRTSGSGPAIELCVPRESLVRNDGK